MAGVPRMGGQRQAVSTCANDGNLIIAGIHLFFHCGKGIKPGIIPGFLPGKALHCRDDGQEASSGRVFTPPGALVNSSPRFWYWARMVSAKGCTTSTCFPASAALQGLA